MTEIEKFNPCKEAVEYRKEYKTFEDAWNNCPRGDWMLWIASKLKVNHRKLTLAKAYCAETVLHLMKDERSINAVKVAKRYGRGRADKNELTAVTAAAYAAACAAAAYGSAAYGAAAAAYAAAYGSAAAAYAAAYGSAAYGAAAYAADADKKDNQLKTANICRKYLTKEVFKQLKKREG